MQQGTLLSAVLEKETSIENAQLILAISEASKVLSNAVRNASLLNLTGAMNNTNVQGETVQKLDDFSNQVLMDYCKASQVCAGYLSEENEGVATLNPAGKYVVAIDPLDGSSNIDVAAPIGTIFNIWERKSAANNAISDDDFMQKGTATVAAGFVLYGSGTLLVLSVGKGVNIFTLDSIDNEFKLSKYQINLPKAGAIYSINQGSLSKFEKAAIDFVNYCTENDGATNRPYSLRYIGSMVGDMYRTFIKGGVFLYPGDSKEGKGKLRLLYECIPMAFLASQAGGSATNGVENILEILPSKIHERAPIVIGSADMVASYLSFKK